jgi:hypothetical protein
MEVTTDADFQHQEVPSHFKGITPAVHDEDS